MYWLLDDDVKDTVRYQIETLVKELSVVTGSVQSEQLFPFVGRKDLRKARAIVRTLTSEGETVLDPFSGSGIFPYAAEAEGREVLGNEWEPYTYRMAGAPWRLPCEGSIDAALEVLTDSLASAVDQLYGIVCSCGSAHVMDSLFFDRAPLRYVDVVSHERLGSNGETITYRRMYKCPNCGATEKPFEDDDLRRISSVEAIPLGKRFEQIFSSSMIKNSRINLSDSWLIYGNLFPHRSKVALSFIWSAIEEGGFSDELACYMKDAMLAILPQAKYKDYRGKSQDLHVPAVQLREVNVFYRFFDSVRSRAKGLRRYAFSGSGLQSPLSCRDYRDFLSSVPPRSARLVLTDPPWTEANAYFEKAQLYHPWLEFVLSDDADRLEREMVVTDAPSREAAHDEDRWWSDAESFFALAGQVTEDLGYLALYFRPTPASRWLENINKLKFEARRAGFEPLLTVDVSSSDPSMRIQQSASYAFSSDIVFVFLRLPEGLRRVFMRHVDLDHLAFQAGSMEQELLKRPISEFEWRSRFRILANAQSIPEVNLPAHEESIRTLFNRYMREVSPGRFLVKPGTPFSGQLFDLPAAERLFAYVPSVVSELTSSSPTFTYDMFLIKLAGYVENGTRSLIADVQSMNMRKIISPYAVPSSDGRHFTLRPVPVLPNGTREIMELDPYEFEHFSAELLRRQGYSNVAVQGGSGDRGVDISATDPAGVSVVVQCKRYIGNVSATPIQRLHSFALTRGAGRRIVMTTSGFTRDAIDEAHRTATELIDGPDLEILVATYLPEFGR